MGKYEPLTRFLDEIDGDDWEASFAGIEQILGFALPESAYQYQAWWANQSGGGHSQTRGWRDAGFETRNLDLSRKRVRFERTARRSRAKAGTLESCDGDLWARAQALTGIRDRESLIKAALDALIQRDAAKYLTSLGGTMPDAEAPPRRRLD